MLARIKFSYDTIVSEQDYEKIVSLVGEEALKRNTVVVQREDGRFTTYSESFMTYETTTGKELVTKTTGYVALTTDKSFIVDLEELYAAVPMELILCGLVKQTAQEMTDIEIIKNALLDVRDIMMNRR